MAGIPGTDWASATYEEITTIANRDGSTLVLPIGSLEQHGRHLPVATDTLLVEAVATGAVDRLEEDRTVVAPSLWSGYSPHHLPFGGTMTLEFRTMLDVVENLGESALENGFDALLLLNGHGGNIPLVSAATSTVGRAHPDVEVLGLTYFALAERFIDEIRDSEPGGMAHGGEFETSLMLHLHPELVRTDRIDGEPLDESYDLGDRDLMEGGPLSVYRSFDAYSESGAIGRPDLATAEKGEAIFQQLGAELASLLREISDRNQVD